MDSYKIFVPLATNISRHFLWFWRSRQEQWFWYCSRHFWSAINTLVSFVKPFDSNRNHQLKTSRLRDLLVSSYPVGKMLLVNFRVRCLTSLKYDRGICNVSSIASQIIARLHYLHANCIFVFRLDCLTLCVSLYLDWISFSTLVITLDVVTCWCVFEYLGLSNSQFVSMIRFHTIGWLMK